MEERLKSPSFYIVNVSGLLLVLSVVGSTLRFTVISVTLISWLQTQWLAYTSTLKTRRSARLAAAADSDRTRRRKQIADISEAVGENVISLLDKRRQELVLTLDQEAERKRQSYRQDIVTRITNDLEEFQESERIKDEQRLKFRESRLSQREREIDERDQVLQARQKSLDEREQKIKESEWALRKRQELLQEREQKAQAAEDNMKRIHRKQEEIELQSRVVSQPPTVSTPFPTIPLSPPPSVNKSIILPADLLAFADDLNSYHFTCIGVTKKGTRCGQSMISNFDKSAAATRIAEMISPGQRNVALFEMKALRELADWMLCPRWHRDQLPQGAGIASKWYHDLSDARVQLRNQAVSSYETPPSLEAPNTFGGASTGNSTGTTASSFGSSAQPVFIVHTDPRSKSFQLEKMTTTSSTFGQQAFGGSAARNLTPVFASMSQEPAVMKKGYGQW